MARKNILVIPKAFAFIVRCSRGWL